jgi:hypothetical protein
MRYASPSGDSAGRAPFAAFAWPCAALATGHFRMPAGLAFLPQDTQMETHPQKAEDMPIGDGDLTVVVRTIDPILDQLFDGAMKGALHADDLVDIATRIRTILHEAVARQGAALPLKTRTGSAPPA